MWVFGALVVVFPFSPDKPSLENTEVKKQSWKNYNVDSVETKGVVYTRFIFAKAN